MIDSSIQMNFGNIVRKAEGRQGLNLQITFLNLNPACSLKNMGMPANMCIAYRRYGVLKGAATYIIS